MTERFEGVTKGQLLLTDYDDSWEQIARDALDLLNTWDQLLAPTGYMKAPELVEICERINALSKPELPYR